MSYVARFIEEARKGKSAAWEYVRSLNEEDVRRILRTYGVPVPENDGWARERAFRVLRDEAIRKDRKLINNLI
ncbi:MAG: hypothetical protein GXO63_02610 [Candidatus Micrarchaeota archaeon]|nr:hypothetical protein [Candidatus Micrarchaeota archaeon]